ncbi:hypothetical protein V6N11_069023 [Hibiscus sabdariffa]|uniref:Uncharacterized protein n=1 Tax=Hibiscus sabdariffa TaxID=183260 RepID=A0ABR1Z689_9ROSI
MDPSELRYYEDDDTLTMKTIKGVTIGLVRTLKMMGHCGMTFAAIGGVYIGVEQLLQNYMMKRDFANDDLEKMGHVKLMESKWRQISEEASSPLSILEKMRLLKGFLKVWNTESFGSVDLQIEVTTELLNDLEGRDKGVEELIDTRHQL